MKYYVLLIVTYSDGTKDKISVYTYTTEAEALKNFYIYMGSYINGDGVASVCVEAKNNVGGIYKNEVWTKPVEEIEEETTEVEDNTTDDTIDPTVVEG